MMQFQFLRGGVANAGLRLLRLFAQGIRYANAVANALVRKCTTLFHSTKAAVFTILATSSRFVKSVIMKLQTALFRR